MPDHIPAPDVETRVHVGGFTLLVYAYRHLTPTEGRLAVSEYMRQQNLKKLPSTGSAKVFTLFGSNPADDL